MADKKLNSIKKLTEEFLEKLSVQGTVIVDEGPEETVNVRIDTEENGLLIGYHGETLNSLQLLLGALAFKSLGEWVRLVVHVGDYREKREETIRAMAARFAEEVASSKQPIAMPDLSAFERRIVHMALADHPLVTSESEGEGRERRLVIKPK